MVLKEKRIAIIIDVSQIAEMLFLLSPLVLYFLSNHTNVSNHHSCNMKVKVWARPVKYCVCSGSPLLAIAENSKLLVDQKTYPFLLSRLATSYPFHLPLLTSTPSYLQLKGVEVCAVILNSGQISHWYVDMDSWNYCNYDKVWEV